MNKLMVFSVCAALVAGCADTAGTRVTLDTATGDAKILECSTRLANRAKVTKVAYSETDGIKRATMTIESLTNRRQNLQARMVWSDAEGTEIDADGKPFRSLVLDGKDFTTFTGLAPNAKCVTARLQLREGDSAQ